MPVRSRRDHQRQRAASFYRYRRSGPLRRQREGVSGFAGP
jgi:hypothetical protein